MAGRASRPCASGYCGAAKKAAPGKLIPESSTSRESPHHTSRCLETAARSETKVSLKNIRRESWQWRENDERREDVEKASRRLNKPPFCKADCSVISTHPFTALHPHLEGQIPVHSAVCISTSNNVSNTMSFSTAISRLPCLFYDTE